MSDAIEATGTGRGTVGRDDRRTGRSWPHGIAVRVAAAAAAITLVLLSGGALLVRASLHRAQAAATVALARSQADQIAELTQQNVRLSGQWGQLPYELVRSDGVLVSSSPELARFEASGPALPVPVAGEEQLVGATTSVRLADDAGGPLAGRTLTAVYDVVDATSIAHTGRDLPGGTAPTGALSYRVYVLATTATADATVAAVDPFLVIGVTLATLFVAGTAAVAARRALRPVDRIRAEAAAISGSTVRGRVAVPGTADELAALAVTINAMLDRLESALQVQRRFALDAAHELRSPVTSFMVALEIASAHPQIDSRDALEHALTEARRIRDLVEDLLDFADAPPAEPDTGAGPAAGTVTDVGAVVARLVAGAAPGSPAVEVHGTGPGRVVLAEPRLARILRNLLDNAWRHAAAQVEVRWQSVPGGGGTPPQVRIEILNDGRPVPTTDLERVFEAFVRLDDARSRDAGGTGLGLTISREIARASGGSLGATVDGARTCFRLELPAADEQAQ